jgi:hypothetical protein
MATVEPQCSTPQSVVSQLTGKSIWQRSDGVSQSQLMQALTFCCCALALSLGISVAASPDGHNPVRAYAMASASQR